MSNNYSDLVNDGLSYNFANYAKCFATADEYATKRFNANTVSAGITSVRMLVPNKVVEVEFADGAKEKSVCDDEDTFSLEAAISICITKHLMGGTSSYNKAIRCGLKTYEFGIKKAAAEQAEKERIEKKKAKARAKREAQKYLQIERMIEIQKEAYLRAMREFQEEIENV